MGTEMNLAKHLTNFIEHEEMHGNVCFVSTYPDGTVSFDVDELQIVIQRGIEAFELTEGAKVDSNVPIECPKCKHREAITHTDAKLRAEKKLVCQCLKCGYFWKVDQD